MPSPSPVFANVLQPLVDFFEGILKFFHDTIGTGWGLSIILMTVVVRACLLPLTLKQFHGMQRLAKVQPEIKRLQEKHKNDRERLNQEMMRFYKENKVNPFASCLPLVAQLPVFFSLFYMLRKDLRVDICPEIQNTPQLLANPRTCGEGQDAGFLFIPDLTSKATGAVLIALIVLYVGSQLFSTLLMSTTTDRNQKLIMLALPFVFVAFVVRFPAGLLVYWITTNLWTIVQQAIVRKRLGPLRPPETPQAAVAMAEAEERKREREPRRSKDRELVGSSSSKPARPAGPPPAPPRKKKKRSGRRR